MDNLPNKLTDKRAINHLVYLLTAGVLNHGIIGTLPNVMTCNGRKRFPRPTPGMWGRAIRPTARAPECTACGTSIDSAYRATDRGTACCYPPPPSVRGMRADEDGETATRWALFSRSDVEAWLDCKLDGLLCNNRDNHLAEDITGWWYDYNGPGRWFWKSPWVRVTRTRVLVMQSGGLDI